MSFKFCFWKTWYSNRYRTFSFLLQVISFLLWPFCAACLFELFNLDMRFRFWTGKSFCFTTVVCALPLFFFRDIFYKVLNVLYFIIHLSLRNIMQKWWIGYQLVVVFQSIVFGLLLIFYTWSELLVPNVHTKWRNLQNLLSCFMTMPKERISKTEIANYWRCNFKCEKGHWLIGFQRHFSKSVQFNCVQKKKSSTGAEGSNNVNFGKKGCKTLLVLPRWPWTQKLWQDGLAEIILYQLTKIVLNKNISCKKIQILISRWLFRSNLVRASTTSYSK